MGHQYVVTVTTPTSDYQRGYATRAGAEAAALRHKRKRAHERSSFVSVDYVPDGGPFCPIPELTDEALAARVAAEAHDP